MYNTLANIYILIQPDFHVVPSLSQYNPEDEEDVDELDELITPEKIEGATEEEEEEPLPPIEWHPAVLMVGRFIKTLLSPIVKVVFAPQTQRAVVKSLVIIIVVAWILLTSFTAYLTFYQRYIPKTAHVEPIYFQYTDIERPQGQVYFRGPNPVMVSVDLREQNSSLTDNTTAIETRTSL